MLQPGSWVFRKAQCPAQGRGCIIAPAHLGWVRSGRLARIAGIRFFNGSAVACLCNSERHSNSPRNHLCEPRQWVSPPYGTLPLLSVSWDACAIVPLCVCLRVSALAHVHAVTGRCAYSFGLPAVLIAVFSTSMAEAAGCAVSQMPGHATPQGSCNKATEVSNDARWPWLK